MTPCSLVAGSKFCGEHTASIIRAEVSDGHLPDLTHFNSEDGSHMLPEKLAPTYQTTTWQYESSVKSLGLRFKSLLLALLLLLFRRMNVTAKRSCKNYPAVKSLITKIFT
jgi:hypothetical protein